MKPYRLAAALALLLALASSADAQQVSRRRGFWASFGAGGGWSSVPDGGSLRGGSAYLRMGGTVNRNFLFGGEALFWFRDDGYDRDRGGGDFGRVNVTATGIYYPRSDFDVFLKAGFGVATVENGVGRDAEGIGTTLGIGYDLRLGSNFYVTPNLDSMFHWLSDFTEWSLVFTLGLTWH